MRQKKKKYLLEYWVKYQEEGVKTRSTLEIVGGVDEVFFKDMLVLVMLDLSTGYMLCEKAAKNRTYES